MMVIRSLSGKESIYHVMREWRSFLQHDPDDNSHGITHMKIQYSAERQPV